MSQRCLAVSIGRKEKKGGKGSRTLSGQSFPWVTLFEYLYHGGKKKGEWFSMSRGYLNHVRIP